MHKLSSFWLVVLLVSNAFRIDLRIDGQLPLVISFEAVSLFVLSGTGFMQSNFNAATSDSKLSLRDVPMIKAFTLTLCYCNHSFGSVTSVLIPTQFRDLVV